MAFRLVVLVVVGRIRFLVLTPCVGTKADTVPGGATKVVAAKPAAAAVKRVRLGMVFFGLCYQGPAVSEYGTVGWPSTVLLEQCGFYYSGACVRRVKKRISSSVPCVCLSGDGKTICWHRAEIRVCMHWDHHSLGYLPREQKRSLHTSTLKSLNSLTSKQPADGAPSPGLPSICMYM